MSDAAKSLLRGNFIALNAYIEKNKNIYQSPVFHLNKLEVGKIKPRWSKEVTNTKLTKGVTKIKAEISEIEQRQTIAKINKESSWFFEKK